MKNTLKWKRTQIIYPTEHIISSKARELNTLYGFKPEYENEKGYNLKWILGNEYMRLWFKERALYQKENYAKHEMAKNDVNLKRGYVQKMMINPKLTTRELPVIQLKRFQNVISKIDNRRSVDEKTKICERFKKSFEPLVLNRYKPSCPLQTKANGLNEKRIQGAEKKSPKAKSKKQVWEDSDQIEEKNPNCPLVCTLVSKK